MQARGQEEDDVVMVAVVPEAGDARIDRARVGERHQHDQHRPEHCGDESHAADDTPEESLLQLCPIHAGDIAAWVTVVSSWMPTLRSFMGDWARNVPAEKRARAVGDSTSSTAAPASVVKRSAKWISSPTASGWGDGALALATTARPRTAETMPAGSSAIASPGATI